MKNDKEMRDERIDKLNDLNAKIDDLSREIRFRIVEVILIATAIIFIIFFLFRGN